MKPKILFWIAAISITGCSFNFDITSQRTALENQIIGSYQELNDDVVVSSSVRSLDSKGQKKEISISRLQEEAIKARQSQQFNLDDIDELKNKEVIGEKNNGFISLLPAGIGKASDPPTGSVKLAETIIKEENHDREVVWKRVITSNESLSDKDLGDVKKAFVRMQREAALKGQWLQDEQEKWYQKK